MDVTLQRHSLGLTWIERQAMARSAHALADGDRVWFIDPFDHPDAMAAAQELGHPAGVIQLLDRHNRDCQPIADRLGVPLHRLPTGGVPFMTIPVIANRAWREVALWWPDRRALVVAEALGTAPLFRLERRAGVHPMLRLTPPRRQLGGYAPDMLLVGHGKAIEANAASALAEALEHSRGDLPRMILSAPKILRGGS